jgi:hypothetical protein
VRRIFSSKWPRNPKLLLAKNLEEMKKIIKKSFTKKQVTLEGMMTFGMLENGLRIADFECCEDVEMEQFITKCKVQGMRDGNLYMTELPRRQRNKPIFRDDNASFSHGKDGKYYFYFALDEERIGELPEQLVRQASAIAQKIIRELICN